MTILIECGDCLACLLSPKESGKGPQGPSSSMGSSSLGSSIISPAKRNLNKKKIILETQMYLLGLGQVHMPLFLLCTEATSGVMWPGSHGLVILGVNTWLRWIQQFTLLSAMFSSCLQVMICCSYIWVKFAAFLFTLRDHIINYTSDFSSRHYCIMLVPLIQSLSKL